MRSASAGLLFATCIHAALACSTLPEYAAPKAGFVSSAPPDHLDVAPYRALVRADFKAAGPPAAFAKHADKLFAATCGIILATPDTRLEVRSVSSPNGSIVYRATPRHLRFQARMDRNCSWWNPTNLGVPEAYVLEHEQIHFALFELEARRLNASIEEIQSGIDATAASRDAALEMAEKQLGERIQARMDAILERSRAFDEDTSLGYRPEQQKEWWGMVQAELAETGE